MLNVKVTEIKCFMKINVNILIEGVIKMNNIVALDFAMQT